MKIKYWMVDNSEWNSDQIWHFPFFVSNMSWGIEFSRSRLMIQYSENHFLYYSHYYQPQNWHCDNVPSPSVSQVTSGISHSWPPLCSNTNETWHNFPGLKSWNLNLCLRPQPLFFLKYVTDSCLPIISSEKFISTSY